MCGTALQRQNRWLGQPVALGSFCESGIKRHKVVASFAEGMVESIREVPPECHVFGSCNHRRALTYHGILERCDLSQRQRDHRGGKVVPGAQYPFQFQNDRYRYEYLVITQQGQRPPRLRGIVLDQGADQDIGVDGAQLSILIAIDPHLLHRHLRTRILENLLNLT